MKGVIVKDSLVKSLSTVKVIWKNFVEFLDAVCLATVSGYAIYMSLNDKGMRKLWAYALLTAGVVIALQAFLLLVRHFNKPVGN